MNTATKGPGYRLSPHGFSRSKSTFAGNQIWVDGLPIDGSRITMHLPHRVCYIASSSPAREPFVSGDGLRHYFAMLWDCRVQIAVALAAAGWWPHAGETKVYRDLTIRGTSVSRHAIPRMDVAFWQSILSQPPEQVAPVSDAQWQAWCEEHPETDSSLEDLLDEQQLTGEATAHLLQATLLRGGVSRPITALIFEERPDMSPLHGKSLAALIRLLDLHRSVGGTIAVHCMGGMGRTGAFIAADALSQQRCAQPHAAPYSLLLQDMVSLRSQRPHMLESHEQLAAALASASFGPGVTHGS